MDRDQLINLRTLSNDEIKGKLALELLPKSPSVERIEQYQEIESSLPALISDTERLQNQLDIMTLKHELLRRKVIDICQELISNINDNSAHRTIQAMIYEIYDI